MDKNNHGLELDKFYMNPHTGSVDTGIGWLTDYRDADCVTWERWGGGDLIEVIKGKDGWEEVL